MAIHVPMLRYYFTGFFLMLYPLIWNDSSFSSSCNVLVTIICKIF